MTSAGRDRDTIVDLIEARAQALRAKDPDQIAASTAPGVVTFALAPPLATTGLDHDDLAAWLASWDGPIGYEVSQLAVSVAGDVGFAHSLDHLHGERIGEPATDLWVRTTVGLERIDGRWLVTHEHQSVPFAMDGSGRALLDLTP